MLAQTVVATKAKTERSHAVRPTKHKLIQPSREKAKMRGIKILGLCFIAPLALSAVFAASALALKNPRWAMCAVSSETRGQWKDSQCSIPGNNSTHETKILAPRLETRAITVEANEAKGSQKLSAPAIKLVIECKKVKAKPGAILIGGEPGEGAETLVYEGCGVEGHSNCKINKEAGETAKIETGPLDFKLAYKTKKAEEEEDQQNTVTVFKPQIGNTFADIEVEGNVEGECASKALEKLPLPVDGEIACENVSGDEHLVTHEINCTTVRVEKYWLQLGEKQTNS
jgi:hypothetical protein